MVVVFHAYDIGSYVPFCEQDSPFFWADEMPGSIVPDQNTIVAKRMTHDSENLFSYGTLQLEPVQLAAFGRKLAGQPDALIGYRVELIATKDHEFEIKSGATQHRNLRYTGDTLDLVEGTVFKVTKEELEQSDAYEPWDYQRVQVQLESGTKAWVYLQAEA